MSNNNSGKPTLPPPFNPKSTAENPKVTTPMPATISKSGNFNSITPPFSNQRPLSSITAVQQPITLSKITKNADLTPESPKQVEEALQNVLLHRISIDESLFSRPRQTIVLDQQIENPTEQILDVGLETESELPEAISDLILGYDDELRYRSRHDREVGCAIQLTIARLLEYAGEEKLAYSRFIAAHRRNPKSLSAITELRRIARAYRRDQDVVEYLRAELACGVSVKRQAEILEKLARYLRLSPNHQTEVLELLERAIKLNPSNVSLLELMQVSYLHAQKWERVLKVLGELYETTKDLNSKSSFSLQRAEICDHCVKDGKLAAVFYLNAFDLRPESRSMILSAEPYLIQEKRWKELYLSLSSHCEEVESISELHGFRIRAGLIARDFLKSRDEAISSLEHALALKPNDPLSLSLMEEIYSESSKYWMELDRVYELLYESTSDLHEKAYYASKRANSLWNHGTDKIKAVEVLENVLKQQPQQHKLLTQISECYLNLSKPSDSAAALARRAEKMQGEEACNAYSTLGRIYMKQKSTWDEAIFCFGRALSINACHKESFECLEMILCERGDYQALSGFYESRLQSTLSARDKAVLLKRMAVLYEMPLAQPLRAISLLRQYREVYPDDLEVIHSLQRLCRRTSRWAELIEMLHVEKLLSKDPIQQAEILAELASICDEYLMKPHQAVELYRMSLETHHGLLETYRRLRELYRRLKQYSELVLHLQRMLEQFPTSDWIDIYNELGELYTQNLNNDDEALICYRKVLEMQPMNMEAISATERIYMRREDWSSYCEFLIWKSQLSYSAIHRASFLFRAAYRLDFHLKQYPESERLLRRILEIIPNYSSAIQALESLLARTGQWVELCDFLRSNIQKESDVQIRSEMAYRLGSILYWRLGERDEALQSLELALALNPQISGARETLCRILFETAQYKDLCTLYNECAEHCNDNALKIAYSKEVVDLSTGERNSSFEGLAHAESLIALKRIMSIDNMEPYAMEIMESLESSRARLGSFWQRRLSTAQADEAVELRLSIAEVGFIDDPQANFEMLCEAVNLAPHHMPAIRMAANSALKLNNMALACRFREAEAQVLKHPAMKIIAWQTASKIASSQLHRMDIAIEDARQAFVLAPHRMDLCDDVLTLMESQLDWLSMTSILELHLEALADMQKSSRLLQLASLYEIQLKDIPKAITKLRALLHIEPEHKQALIKLKELEESLGHWAELRICYQRILSLKDLTLEEQRAHRLGLVHLLMNILNRYPEAEIVIKEQLKINSNDLEFKQLLSSLYILMGRYDDCLVIYQQLVNVFKGFERAEILLKIASLNAKLNRVESMKENLENILLMGYDDFSIFNLLFHWCNEHDPMIIVDLLERNLRDNHNLSEESTVEVYNLLARITREFLKMNAEADRYCLECVELMPRNVKARILAATIANSPLAITHSLEALRMDKLSIPALELTMKHAKILIDKRLQAYTEQLLLANKAIDVNSCEFAKQFSNTPIWGPKSLNRELMLNYIHASSEMWVYNLLWKAGPKLQIYELPKLEYINSNKISEYQKVLEETAAIFSETPFTLKTVHGSGFTYYFSPNHNSELLLSQSFLNEATQSEARFVFACAYAHKIFGTWILKVLDEKDFMRLFRGLLGLAYEGYGEDDIVRLLSSFLSRKEKKLVVEHLRNQPLDNLQLNFAQWRYYAELNARRIGMLVANDATAAIKALLRETITPADENLQNKLANIHGINDLIEFIIFVLSGQNHIQYQ